MKSEVQLTYILILKLEEFNTSVLKSRIYDIFTWSHRGLHKLK
jgi:hypothetical protein